MLIRKVAKVGKSYKVFIPDTYFHEIADGVLKYVTVKLNSASIELIPIIETITKKTAGRKKRE